MNFDEYQKKAIETAIYPNRGESLIYPVLGLGGETGEIQEKVKKMLRDKGGVLDEETRQALIRELGDVLWYAAAIAFELKTSLDHVAQVNIEKLMSRKARGVLGGSGDQR